MTERTSPTAWGRRCDRLKKVLLERFSHLVNADAGALSYLVCCVVDGATYEQIIDKCEIASADRFASTHETGDAA